MSKTDMVGLTWGKLTVLKWWSADNVWLCCCACGNECLARKEDMLELRQLDCGCGIGTPKPEPVFVPEPLTDEQQAQITADVDALFGTSQEKEQTPSLVHLLTRK